MAFSVIAMEWFDKISEFMEIVCGWRWTYSRPGSWGGNFWLGTLGEKSYRFWLGLIVAAAAGLALFLFFVTGQE